MDVGRFRAAERTLWQSVGSEPREHRVTLPRLGVRVRVQEVGTGTPVLFVHGGPNSGSTWAPLVGRLDPTRFRCLLLDRPGTGLSGPLDLRRTSAGDLADVLVPDTLDALGIERSHVIASSLGGYCALRSAARRPERFRRMVQVACPALLDGQRPPPFMRLLMWPGVRRLVAALPPHRRAQESILRQIGHGASLDAGRLQPAHQDWYEALHRHTDTMRHDFDLIHSLRGPAGGFDPTMSLTAADLAGVDVPTHVVWGADDTFGSVETARWLVAALPRASLEVLPEAGHLPWLDWPEQVAGACAAFLAADDEAERSA